MTTPGGDSQPGGEPPEAVPARPRAGEHRLPAPKCCLAAQVIAALVLMTGLWVATSPRFLTLRGGADAATDVIIGLVVAGIGALALVTRRGFPGPRFASLVLGVWVVLITSFVLDFRLSGAAPWYWSNTWSGAVLAVLALAELSTFRPAAR